MKIFDLQRTREPEQSLTLRTPWIRLTLCFGKKREQPADEREWLEQQRVNAWTRD